MPSETLIPAITSMLVLLLAIISFIGVYVTSTRVFAELYEAKRDYIVETSTRVEIVNATVIQVVFIDNIMVNITLRIEVRNEGPLPLYDFNHTDILVVYKNSYNETISKMLVYGENWYIKQVFLTESYSIDFSAKPIIESNEIAIIEAWFTMEKSDYDNLSEPVRLLFISQYGTRDSVWVDIRA
ncbi:MAG: hypothetical protein ABWW65_05970 [Thermoprotei archaeon]